MKLTFNGGAQSVTGANYLLETANTRILIDCGLHQGGSYCEKHNFEPFPFDPQSIDAVFITHAHIDHIGRLPQLVRAGFSGRILSTPPTKDFAEFLLLDSEHLLREDALEAHREPIYSIEDVNKTMTLWDTVSYHEPYTVQDFTVMFWNAGHILGSSCILVTGEGKRVLFSGDLGNMPAPFITSTEPITERVDYALIESVYGGRVHENLTSRADMLERLIGETVRAGGTLMLPAFALERTQEMIFELNALVENNRIPSVPVFIDSPLAIKLTAVYQKYSTDKHYFNADALSLIRKGDAIFDFPGLRMTLTTAQSKEINGVHGPKVIIAGAGMSNGGRIRHHEARYLGDPKSTILFVGYQAYGSLGRHILDGAKEVTIFGERIPVRCRVHAIGGFSAHADQPQLLAWARSVRDSVKTMFVVQGESDEARPLAEKLQDELGITARIPEPGESVMV